MTNDPKKFVIVIPSYQNEKWCVQNITSALNQEYKDYRIIFTDDCSTDNTFKLVSETVNQHTNKDKVQLIKNEARLGALHNLYNMIYSCQDDEIIVSLDGDDWLKHHQVLTTLNGFYAGNDIWMTYGQYENSDGGIGISRQIPGHVINNNSYRQYHWCASHLRTFYTWLFKKINKEDLMKDNQFYGQTWDMAFMFSMLEMSGYRAQFISDILYVYNNVNPINDHKVNLKLQQDLDFEIRHKPRYARTKHHEDTTNKLPPLFYEPRPKLDTQRVAPIYMLKIGLIIMAVNDDVNKLNHIIETANKFFIKGSSNITYYIFSDRQVLIKTGRKVVYLHIEQFQKSDRFEWINHHSNQLMHQTYLYYLDIDCIFKDRVEAEIIGDLMGIMDNEQTQEVEDNTCSYLYMEPDEYRHYLNIFSGGKTEHYLHLSRCCQKMIDKDRSDGIFSKHHDTSAINRYFYDYRPDIILGSNYKGIAR